MITINITTCNRKEMSKFCIDSLLSTTPRDQFELIVVDNHSNDGTIKMLEEMKENGVINKLILNSENKHLGYAVNQAWDISASSSKWLIWVNNDFFFMDGWLQNFKRVVQGTGVDYISCLYLEGLIRKKVAPGIPKITKDGGNYLQEVLRSKKKYDVGAAPAIKKSVWKKYHIRVPDKPFQKGYTGPGPLFYRTLFEKGLKGVRLDKPSILMQDPNFNNPDYLHYYNHVYGIRGLDKLYKFLKNKGSYFKNPTDYYSGTNYMKREI